MATALVLPHLLYFGLVWLPESAHQPDEPYEDRTYIEYEQMAYTHFDLLAIDKTNFGLTPQLQDSMMLYFKNSAAPQYLIKFNNNDLMWGSAAAMVTRYYNNNYDSIENYYKQLNKKLITNYPIELTCEISKQVLAFYVPNFTVHKDLFNAVDFTFSYNENTRIASRIKPVVLSYIANAPAKSTVATSAWGTIKTYQLSPGYPTTIAKAEAYNIYQLPLLFKQGFWFYRFFSPLFLAAMLAFFAIRAYSGQLIKLHIITLQYLLIFIYVLTIAIVHTFDCTRFVITIYPFLLVNTCMAMVYIADFVLNRKWKASI